MIYRRLLPVLCWSVTFLLLLGASIVISPAPAHALGDLRVHFIDVDAPSDAIYVQLPDGKSMLVDAAHGGVEVARVKAHLATLGVDQGDRIDYVFGTHRHADHIGGMPEIISDYDVGTYYQPDEGMAPGEHAPTDAVNAALQAKSLTVTRPVAGQDVFNVDSGELQLTMLAPNGTGYDNPDDYSIVLKLTYGSRSIVLTGDASLESENEMLSQGYNVSADVLKVGHHGSNSSTSPGFLAAVSPTHAVITSDVDRRASKKRGLTPTKTVLDALYGAGVSVRRVGEQGTIILTTDGSTLAFNKPSVTLSDYGYGSQLPENQLPEKDYLPSGDSMDLRDHMVNFGNFATNWEVKEGEIDDNEVVPGTEGSDGGSYEIATDPDGNKYIRLYRTGTEQPEIDLQVEKTYTDFLQAYPAPLIGNIEVEARFRVTGMGGHPETHIGTMYLLPQDGSGLPLATAEFNATDVFVRNYGSTNYPETRAAIGLNPGTWHTIKFTINTRSAKFDISIDGVQNQTWPRMNLTNMLDDSHLAGIAFRIEGASGEVHFDDIKISSERYLMQDDFDDHDFVDWVQDGNVGFTHGNAFLGEYAAALNNADRIRREVSTVGFDNVAIDVAWRTKNFAASDQLIGQWYDGTTWHEFGSKGAADTDYRADTYYLPAAAGNGTISVRFRVTGVGGDAFGFVDNVFVRGTN